MSYNKLRLLLVAWTLSSEWMKLCGSHAIRGSYFTCCKNKFALGRWNTQHVQILMQKGVLSTFCNNLICCKQPGWFVGGKTRNIAIQVVQFCSNVAEQVAQVCCPLYRTFRLWSTSVLGSRDLSCAVSGFGQVLKVTPGGFKSASCLFNENIC